MAKQLAADAERIRGFWDSFWIDSESYLRWCCGVVLNFLHGMA